VELLIQAVDEFWLTVVKLPPRGSWRAAGRKASRVDRRGGWRS